MNLNCQSCGMPMDKPGDHGGGNPQNQFCKYCTDEQGNLLPREQVRARMIQFYIQKQGKTREEAEKATDQLMTVMPAWKGEELVAPAEPITLESQAEPKPAASEPEEKPKPTEPETAPGPGVTTEQTTESVPEPSRSMPGPTQSPITTTQETPPVQPIKPEDETLTE